MASHEVFAETPVPHKPNSHGLFAWGHFTPRPWEVVGGRQIPLAESHSFIGVSFGLVGHVRIGMKKQYGYQINKSKIILN